MNDIAVRVDNLGKRYRISSGRRFRHTMLREVLTRVATSPFTRRPVLAADTAARRGTSGAPMAESEHIWALRNVSFEVPRGQILGIIGPNGAGKSTLLKILSRITEPTEGRIEIHGRVGSLLEVGTGFHPELTGRENVYLSGALLGMRRGEIDRKFEQIVAFSEIEKFIESPVKHYSSGMYVRLAFAVAAHFEPDILIVDEVLAVGDAAFQRRCLNKMQDVREHGRTILFVSHNLSAVTRLCERAILISQGSVTNDGPATDVSNAYLVASVKKTAECIWTDTRTAPGSDVARVHSVRTCDDSGKSVEVVDIRMPLVVEVCFDVLKPGWNLAPWFELSDQTGLSVLSAGDMRPGWRERDYSAGRYVSRVAVPGNLLAEGTFSVTVGLYSPDPDRNHFHLRDSLAVQIVDSFEGDAARGEWQGPVPGVVRPKLEWRTERL